VAGTVNISNSLGFVFKRQRPLGYQGIYGRIILKWFLINTEFEILRVVLMRASVLWAVPLC
jgi:hypothetical protein